MAAWARKPRSRISRCSKAADCARSFQSNYDEAEYEQAVQWMSACSYDNLATATAILYGYNSEGMQACIADGISVCRRTGQLGCITCFREYATQVQRSAHDLPMVLDHARANARRTEFKDEQDCRWKGAFDETDMLILQGELTAAWEAARRALPLSDVYPMPPISLRQTRYHMQTIAVLSGREDWAEITAEVPADAVPAGEDPLAEIPRIWSQRWQAALPAIPLRRSRFLQRGNSASWLNPIYTTGLNCACEWWLWHAWPASNPEPMAGRAAQGEGQNVRRFSDVASRGRANLRTPRADAAAHTCAAGHRAVCGSTSRRSRQGEHDHARRLHGWRVRSIIRNPCLARHAADAGDRRSGQRASAISRRLRRGAGFWADCATPHEHRAARRSRRSRAADSSRRDGGRLPGG